MAMREGLGNGKFILRRREFPCFLRPRILQSGVPVSASSWLQDWEIIHQNETNGGLLVRMNEDEVAKAFPSKGYLLSWARILLKQTKAHKQARSMRSLLRLGLVTPEPLDVLTFYPGTGIFEAALIYRYVDHVVDVSEALKGPLRATILKNLERELAVMANHGVLFVDFHFRNVMSDQEGNLCWIDVEVKEGTAVVEKSFWARVVRMNEDCDPGVLSEDEWLAFQEGIRSQLNDPGRFLPA
jgi:tRNA A-37 threonylcarbamoyl transferase component Bud32